MKEIPFFFPNNNYNLFGIIHHPMQSWGKGGFVFCHPFAEEKLWTHRVYVSFARELAQRGYYVLRFDYMGHGDSDGKFEESTIETHFSDINCAIDWLKNEVPSMDNIGLLGLRFGATLASMIAENRQDINRLILWEPITNGANYMQEMLRSNIATQSAVYKEIRKNREALVESMRKGETVNIDGYEMAYPLFAQSSAIDLFKERKSFSGDCLIVQIERKPTQKYKKELLNLKSFYTNACLEECAEEFFWKEIKHYYQTAVNLFSKTLGWLDGQREE
jgi:exosortase A-associated hydrolase 2